MIDTRVLPPPAKDFDTAKRRYVEFYGSVAVMNTYLKIAVFCLCLATVGLTILQIKTIQLFRNVRPVVIRINELGRAEAVSFGSLDYKPQPAEMKYFLIRFTQQHYGRIRATVREDYAQSLFFLDGRLADALIDDNRRSKVIETFLTDQSDEVEVRVTSVALEDLRTAPYRATVDFEKVFYSASNRAERRREKHTANVVFSFRDHVPNELIPVNPLGFVITYFREDEAF